MEIYLQIPKLYKQVKNKKLEVSIAEKEIFSHFRRISQFINAVVELRTEMEF